MWHKQLHLELGLREISCARLGERRHAGISRLKICQPSNPVTMVSTFIICFVSHVAQAKWLIRRGCSSPRTSRRPCYDNDNTYYSFTPLYPYGEHLSQISIDYYYKRQHLQNNNNNNEGIELKVKVWLLWLYRPRVSSGLCSKIYLARGLMGGNMDACWSELI